LPETQRFARERKIDECELIIVHDVAPARDGDIGRVQLSMTESPPDFERCGTAVPCAVIMLKCVPTLRTSTARGRRQLPARGAKHRSSVRSCALV
jgi:hypothetical protein